MSMLGNNLPGMCEKWINGGITGPFDQANVAGTIGLDMGQISGGGSVGSSDFVTPSANPASSTAMQDIYNSR